MAVVDDGGLEALSLSAVAQRLGVGPSAQTLELAA